MKRMVCLVAAVLITLCAIAESVNAKTTDAIIQEGIKYHDSAKTESDGFAQKCMETLKPYIATNMIARAYYGSAITLSAGYCAESDPFKALSLLQEGAVYIDEAVEKEKDNASLHLIRLVNGIEVSASSPLKRYAVLKNDVIWFEDDENISTLTSGSMAIVYLYCGYYNIEAGDIDAALDLFDMVIESAPDSDSAKEAEKMLARYAE